MTHSHSFSYLAPRACEPIYAILTRTIVADLRIGRSLTATPLQRKAADVVGQAEDSPGPDPHPTFSRALNNAELAFYIFVQVAVISGHKT